MRKEVGLALGLAAGGVFLAACDTSGPNAEIPAVSTEDAPARTIETPVATTAPDTTTPPTTAEPQTTTTTLPEIQTYPLIPANVTNIRVLEVTDLYSDLDSDQPRFHDNLVSILPTAQEMAAGSTFGELDLRFDPVETIHLQYDVHQSLCETSDEESWSKRMVEVEAEVLDIAGESPADVDLLSFDINLCSPDSRANPLSQIAGRAARGGDIVELAIAFDDMAPTPAELLHEVGHHFGLGHAMLADCGEQAPDRALNPNEDQCQLIEYGDQSNVMGGFSIIGPDSFSGYQLGRLDVLKPEQIIDINESGSYVVSSLLSADNLSPKLLRIALKDKWLPGVPEDQEYLYIELSSADWPDNQTPECLDEISASMYRTDCDDRPRSQKVKIYRAADYSGELNDPYANTIAFDLNLGDITESGADADNNKVIYIDETTGFNISVDKIETDELGQAKAVVQVVFSDYSK